MSKSSGTKAEDRYAKARLQDAKLLKEREKARQSEAEKVARLRALRLAKEAADLESAEKTVARPAVAAKG